MWNINASRSAIVKSFSISLYYESSCRFFHGDMITHMKKTILVTGAFGLVGTNLVLELQKKYGKDHVVALGRKTIGTNFDGILEQGDVRDKDAMEQLIKKYEITDVYHLAGLLSAGGEKDPALALDIN